MTRKANSSVGGDPWAYWAAVRETEQFKRQARGDFIKVYKPSESKETYLDSEGNVIYRFKWPARKQP